MCIDGDSNIHTHMLTCAAGDSWGWKWDVYVQRSEEKEHKGRQRS